MFNKLCLILQITDYVTILTSLLGNNIETELSNFGISQYFWISRTRVYIKLPNGKYIVDGRQKCNFSDHCVNFITKMSTPKNVTNSIPPNKHLKLRFKYRGEVNRVGLKNVKIWIQLVDWKNNQLWANFLMNVFESEIIQ